MSSEKVLISVGADKVKESSIWREIEQGALGSRMRENKHHVKRLAPTLASVWKHCNTVASSGAKPLSIAVANG